MRQITEHTVAICMAAYNGEKYIREQIQSIVNQTYRDWVLFIRDDGSTDATLDVIREFADGDSILLVEENVEGHSAKTNFAGLLNHVRERYDFSYFMFCDQDDVWLDSKIDVSMKRLLSLERERGADTPILLHTDLRVVDENLKVLGDSFVRYRSIDTTVMEAKRLVAQNNITGCTMLWNRALNERVKLGHPMMAQHDWWFSVSASLFGVIDFLDTPTVLYRQHGDNSVGATRVNSLGFIFLRLRKLSHVKTTIAMSARQAKAMSEVYADAVPKQQRQMLADYGSILEVSKIKRWRIICKHGCFKQGIIQVIGQMLFV